MPILYSPERNRAVIDGYDDASRQGIAALLAASMPGVRIVRERDDASDWFDVSDPEAMDEAFRAAWPKRIVTAQHNPVRYMHIGHHGGAVMWSMNRHGDISDKVADDPYDTHEDAGLLTDDTAFLGRHDPKTGTTSLDSNPKNRDASLKGCHIKKLASAYRVGTLHYFGRLSHLHPDLAAEVEGAEHIAHSDPFNEAAPQRDDSDEEEGKKPPENSKTPPFGKKKKDDAEDEPSDADPQALDGQQEQVPQGDYVPTLADVQTAYDVMYARGLHDDDIAEKIFQRFGLQLEIDPMGRVLWVPGMADMPLPDAPELKPRIGLQHGHELDFNRVATQGNKNGQPQQQSAESVAEADVNPWLWDRYLSKSDRGRRSDRINVTRTSLVPGRGHPLTHREPRTSFEREMRMPAHQPERVRWMWHPRTGEMRISHAEQDHHATMLDAGENKHYDQWVRGYYFPKHRKVVIRAHPNPGVGEHLVSLLRQHLPSSTTYRTNASTANPQGVEGFGRRGF